MSRPNCCPPATQPCTCSPPAVPVDPLTANECEALEAASLGDLDVRAGFVCPNFPVEGSGRQTAYADPHAVHDKRHVPPTLLERLEKRLARVVEQRYQGKVNAMRHALQMAVEPSGPRNALRSNYQPIEALIDAHRGRLQAEAETETLDALALVAGALLEPN